MRWRDVDLTAGWLTVEESKTDAGRRRVKMRGALMEALEAVRDSREIVEQDAYVFPTRTGRGQYECKVREGTLGGAVKRANVNLATKDLPLVPDKLTPHSLRRTFASTLYAIGARVSARAMRRDADERDELAALIAGEQAHKGTRGDVMPIERARTKAA